MATAEEYAAAVKTPMGAALATGLEAIDQFQVVTFTKYVRVVLPADGFVFWVIADKVQPGALFNAARLNQAAFGVSPSIVTPAPTTDVKGSIHYATVNTQEESAFNSHNQVQFTAEDEIQDLNEIGPAVMFLAEFDGREFAFSKRGSYFQQSNLFHYVGEAVTALMRTQILDDPRALDLLNPVVSNSLPFWLQLAGRTGVPTFPSYLVPQNEPPPYVAVHVAPETTTALQAFPNEDRTGSQWQLMGETVRLTFYGLRNFTALDFMREVERYSLETDNFGLTGSWAVRDEKVTQPELGIIAQKKTAEVPISYFQTRARDVARILMTKATVALTLGEVTP